MNHVNVLLNCPPFSHKHLNICFNHQMALFKRKTLTIVKLDIFFFEIVKAKAISLEEFCNARTVSDPIFMSEVFHIILTYQTRTNT